MKKLLVLTSILISAQVLAQGNLIGAWEWTETSDSGQKKRGVVIFDEKYQVATWYDASTGAFVETNGGSWSIDGNTVTENVEFDTNTERDVIGTSVSFEIEWEGKDKMRIKGDDNWATRIDSGKPGALSGAWIMSGRKRDGEIQQRDTNRPRKTMKILSGTRFQWIAYNIETKQFMGTGGGTYTTIDGVYTENIEFFSRDNTRVGASLPFNFELQEGKWHHSGNSSKGAPIYEIWSQRQ